MATVTRRQIQNYNNFLKRVGPIVEAQRYAECLARDGVGTKAQVAAMFGVSRPRVTQYMNLLKLPSPIRQFLLNHNDDPLIRNYFSEHRLRRLTHMKDTEEILEHFGEMVEDARSASGVWSHQVMA